MRNRLRLLVTGLLILLFASQLLAAKSGKITGKVIGREDGEPLFAANVFLMGTSIGAATDIYGNFEIKGIPAGTYILKVSYLGLEEEIRTIDIADGQEMVQNFELGLATVEGEAVVITAQAAGQKSAINQQLTAKKIMNVVSSARIQELPDANAAESVGRLPGISIQREGGEGTKLVVRGLQPKYNAISVNGVRLSSSDPNDRSVDLSMISPYMLDGIEVSKNVTPDQDADVLGGTVNFKMRRAGGKLQKEGLAYNFIAQSGYNGLSNSYNKYNNYKYVGSVEGRFFDGKFGVFAQADHERKNLTSNELRTNYEQIGNSSEDYRIASQNLHNIPRDRVRTNGSLVFDYLLNEGSISLTNFFSTGETTSQNRYESIDIRNNHHDYNLRYSKSKLNMITNSLNIEKDLPWFHVNATLSHTYSKTENPDDWTITFRQRAAIDDVTPFTKGTNIDPTAISRALNNNLSQTFLTNAVTNSSVFEESAYTAALDIKFDWNISKEVNSEFKFGGKYRAQNRDYSAEAFDGQGLSLASARFVDDLITNNFDATEAYRNSTSIPITAFLDPNYSYGDFLDNEYLMSKPLNFSMMADIANLLRSNADYISENNGSIAYGRNNFLSTSNNYTGDEYLKAFYGMTTIDIGENLNLITGIRYQELETEYKGSRGIQSPLSYYEYTHYDTTVTRTHGYWLPSAILRYKPFDWFDVRFAYTNTVAYPDYNAIIPRIDVGNGQISWNNFELTPSRSTNFDAYFSFYENHIGLFTIGGFYKRIKDLIYPTYFYASKKDAIDYFPPSLVDETTNPTGTYRIDTYVNNPYEIDLYGIEVDWQTHFWYLPQPFDGLVLNVNYTYTYSEAQYPYTDKRGGWVTTYVDTSFIDRLLYQPNDILNLSIGYDYKDLSIRVSMLYQADIFAGVNYWQQLRTTTSDYTRWDISIKQKLPWYGLQVYCLLNNINSEKDLDVLQMYKGVPQASQDYGMSATLGFRWTY